MESWVKAVSEVVHLQSPHSLSAPVTLLPCFSGESETEGHGAERHQSQLWVYVQYA